MLILWSSNVLSGIDERDRSDLSRRLRVALDCLSELFLGQFGRQELLLLLQGDLLRYTGYRNKYSCPPSSGTIQPALSTLLSSLILIINYD